MADFINRLIIVLTVFVSLFFSAEIDNAEIIINNDSITPETQKITFTMVNKTNRCIIDENWIYSFEKKIDGAWVAEDFSYNLREISFTVYPGRSYKNSFGVEGLTAGEYRVTIAYNVKKSHKEMAVGYSTAYFTVSTVS